MIEIIFSIWLSMAGFSFIPLAQSLPTDGLPTTWVGVAAVAIINGFAVWRLYIKSRNDARKHAEKIEASRQKLTEDQIKAEEARKQFALEQEAARDQYMQQQIEQFRESERRARKDYEELQKKHLDEAKDIYRSTKRELDEAKATLQMTVSKYDSQGTLLDEKIKDLNILQKKYDEATQKMADMVAQHKYERETWSTRENQLTSKLDEMRERINELENNIGKINSQMTDKVEGYQSQIKERDETIHILSQQVTTLENELKLARKGESNGNKKP